MYTQVYICNDTKCTPQGIGTERTTVKATCLSHNVFDIFNFQVCPSSESSSQKYEPVHIKFSLNHTVVLGSVDRKPSEGPSQILLVLKLTECRFSLLGTTQEVYSSFYLRFQYVFAFSLHRTRLLLYLPGHLLTSVVYFSAPHVPTPCVLQASPILRTLPCFLNHFASCLPVVFPSLV